MGNSFTKFKFFVPPYGASVTVYIASHPFDIRPGAVGDRFIDEGEEYDFAGKVIKDGSSRWLVYFDSKCADLDTVAHEAYHLTEGIVETYCNKDSDDEPGAYIHGYIMDQLGRHMKIRMPKRKRGS